ncbi:M56 family metallopeptidase [Aurantiacibacter rhizosphaerae]|uniref:Peptidase M56 domain-containing protein n=1 Tax=Aurantiacibacter rhizosphaerae TaxID=2691582 RepID=A0A844XED9_9SPHN|nr:M56 family metallopeptidase [Aurantiacibacter rhizosphaerae]MWV28210.1 hypothetical protein [Aurantiacibacter rhizosphaerae]
MTAFGDWLVDTFIYTSLLIALVLLLRRPVSRWCGPQVAYALWALPFMRFVMPPIVLPAWMAPAQQEAALSPSAPLMVIISDPADSAATAEVAGSAAAGIGAAPLVGITVTDLLLPLWIGGALIFIGWRIREYVQMRRHLLEGSIPVGDAGKVRLVETPAVTGPVAFGIADKVVALPPAFMAHYDIKARDLAIAHELAHHRGHDLVANIAAQPLLALHWFNPLAWWGWRAMRRDQEAACDARVVAGRARSERAVYAEVIASFAAGEHLAMAAPMACPVLGEKSIIHRLRSLTMSEVSPGRRRIGIAAITTTALALPLTASITYAQSEAPPVPDAPAAPLAPEAPLAPQAPLPPMAPQPPAPPSAMMINGEGEHVIVHYDDATGERHVIRQTITRGGEDRQWDQFQEEMEQQIEEQIQAEMEQAEAEMELHEAEIEMAMAEAQRRAHRSADRAVQAQERAVHARERAQHARAVAVRFGEADCAKAGPDGVVKRDLGNGRTATMICDTQAYESMARSGARAGIEAAMVGIRSAMVAIRGNSSIPAKDREEAVREMQEALDELQAEARSLRREHASMSHAKPNAHSTAVAMSWRGRMVSPVQVLSPMRMTMPDPSPVQDEDCEQETRPVVEIVRA